MCVRTREAAWIEVTIKKCKEMPAADFVFIIYAHTYVRLFVRPSALSGDGLKFKVRISSRTARAGSKSGVVVVGKKKNPRLQIDYVMNIPVKKTEKCLNPN